MSSPMDILSRCHRLGLSLWAEGDRIGIAPKKSIPPGLLDEIRAAKPDVLALVRDGEALTPDQLPWLHVARQVLAGEFDGCDRSMRESVVIGLRSIPHPLAWRALELLGAKSTLP